MADKINVTPEREVCVDVLMKITEDGAYNNIALREAFAENTLTERQRAFVTEVVNGLLRNFIYVDYLIDSIAGLPVAKMKPVVRAALRSAVYQLKFLNSAKNFAVCNETVNIVKKRGLTQLAGFVNGVLRNFTGFAEIPLPDKEKDPTSFLSVHYSIPAWLAEIWLGEYGLDKTEAICASSAKAPNVTACINLTKTDKEKLRRNLESFGVIVEDGRLSKNALHLTKTDDLTKLIPFAQGLFHIADESSMAAVETLAPEEGDKILDVCAAPGGKTFYIAYLTNQKAEITAADLHPHKVKLIADGAARLGLRSIKPIVKDAAAVEPKYIKYFDKVLVDAPCSGLGVIRKKPDIRLKKEPDDIIKLVELQRAILSASAEFVKPGGILLYSTCTLNKAENAENADWFKNNFPFEEIGRKTITPDEYDSDGFFSAKFKRND